MTNRRVNFTIATLPLMASALLGTLGGCYLPRARVPLDLPPEPVPLTQLNSPYDDYNAAALDEVEGGLVFSTNRGSNGKQFDIWEAHLQFSGNTVDVGGLKPLHASINSPFHEFGPRYAPDIGLVFASDRPHGKGGLDLYVSPSANGEGANVRPLHSLNSEFDEAYWTSLDTGPPKPSGSPSGPSALSLGGVFASNRDGQGFDAYEVQAGASESPGVTRIDAISGPSDETAFHAFTDGRVYLLFASNRPGGSGDFDLYCTVRTSKKGWLAPVPISYANSSHKEFRPIVLNGPAQSRVLIFSSNRPGGKGGMDLYYVKFDNPCEGLY